MNHRIFLIWSKCNKRNHCCGAVMLQNCTDASLNQSQLPCKYWFFYNGCVFVWLLIVKQRKLSGVPLQWLGDDLLRSISPMAQSCITLIRAFKAAMNTHLPPFYYTIWYSLPVVYIRSETSALLPREHLTKSVHTFLCICVCVSLIALKLWPDGRINNQQSGRIEITVTTNAAVTWSGIPGTHNRHSHTTETMSM